MINTTDERPAVEEHSAGSIAGMPMLLLGIITMFAPIGVAIPLGIRYGTAGDNAMMVIIIVSCSLVHCTSYFVFAGLKILQPNEAYVLTLFGRYIGSLRGPGFFWVNPFAGVTSTPPPASATKADGTPVEKTLTEQAAETSKRKKVSLKVRTLNNTKMKINDEMGNPIEIGIVVMWRVINTAKAIFSVDDFESYVSIQSDAALRNVVRLYPYDAAGVDQMSLKGSSQEVADEIRDAIQEKVHAAGIEVLEARITHLAYAPEIAAAMLQRQQASAVVDARSLIVKGAVGMVREALEQLKEDGIVKLDEERKAQMVSNLLVVLCANRDTQPVVNSGSLY